LKDIFGNLLGGRGEPVREPNPAHASKSRPARPSDNDLYRKGDVIGGKYYVHRILGMGGFGVVLLVSERESNELCALKTFRKEFLALQLGKRSRRRRYCGSIWRNTLSF